jgi:hypothetical protein
MAKFHIRDNGEPGRCVAKSGNCKFGGDEEHHSTKEAAREAFEKKSSEAQNVTFTKKRIPLTNIDEKLENLGLDSSVVSEEEKDFYSELIDEGYRPASAGSLRQNDGPEYIRGEQLVSKNRNKNWSYTVPPNATFTITTVVKRDDYVDIIANSEGKELVIEVANDSTLMVSSKDGYYQSDSYDFKKDLAERQEVKKLDKLEKAAKIDRAIESKLTYDGPTPEWLNKIKDESKALYPHAKEPKIIDIVDSPAGKLAVVWNEHSLKDGDKHIQEERGFTIRETSLISMETGKKLGYVKTEFVDDESLKRSFGDDEWSSIRYMDEFEGSSFGTHGYVDVEPEPGVDKYGRKNRKGVKKINLLDKAKTPEEKLAAKKNIWAESHRALRLTPESMEKESYEDRVAYYNLNVSHAPSSEAEIDKDLKQIRKIADKKYKNFKSDFKTPFVDFSRTEDEIKGTGLGSAMYVYAGRMLGKENKIFRGSGLQSESAGDVWSRFAKNEKLPISKMIQKYSKSEPTECYYLDFRNEK